MAVLRHRRGLWGSELTSHRGPSKAGELGACPLRHQAFQKPPPHWRLLKWLVHQRSKAKAWELGACPLRHQAFQKPPPHWRLLKWLVHQRSKAKAWELGACPLRYQAFQKPPPRWCTRPFPVPGSSTCSPQSQPISPSRRLVAPCQQSRRDQCGTVVDCRPRKDTVTHSFLVMPECPYPLCRCDLLQKLFGLPPNPLRGTEREFLEAVGYYNLWIPGLIEIAKPLNSIEQWAFEELKKALISAPALALPDVTKPFHLHVSEVRSIAKGVLIQTLGPWKRPVAYLSKRLDPVVAGWPACLRAVATTALLVKEADK
ncbi:hypothetical protein QTO34_016931 [Cnephaeus nilssonii]|uniref:Reverse transcriptase/retrotransposon-derived protein RNase H-like domain-containing protein n=1 Tax=Cnephaeus nilssonii TaxID=3371016 RepID=A0AA40I394_CNENI|nr:hypothetical protein QTO34_016931 [Eptesicus nilssonii]